MMPNNYRTESLDIYVGIMIFPQVTSAFLLINIEFLLGDDVMIKLRNMPEIVDVYRVQGMYDIIAKVELDSEEELKELVSEHIRKVEGITGTVTIMIAQGKV
jgi:DNA-binding Lrp family transcriptional regulator